MTTKENIIAQARAEFAPYRAAFEKNPDAMADWTTGMEDILVRNALKYGISKEQVEANTPEYLSFFEQITL
jgi:hypothetical protein